MAITVNDLVVRPGAQPAGRLIRVSRVEPWPLVKSMSLLEDATSRCHGNMIVFDRLVPVGPAGIGEVRLATEAEISDAACLGLLPPEIDQPSGEDGSGDREPRDPGPSGRHGGVAFASPR